MNHIFRGASGNMHMSRRNHNNRKHWETMKEKEKKCWTCGSMPWRVEDGKCEECGLFYQDEVVEVELPTIASSQGMFEDKF